MNFNSLKEKTKNYPLFKLEDILKWFPEAEKQTTLNQINFWTKKGWLEEIRRGIYKLNDFGIKDISFVLANFIYVPSYISLETALNCYGIIPDIPFGITSVTIKKTKSFKIKNYGAFYYHHLKPALFFGYKTVVVEKNYSYNIALPEKALFDYFYLKAKKVASNEGFIEEMRLSLPKTFNCKKLLEWREVVSLKNRTFYNLTEVFLKKYGK